MVFPKMTVEEIRGSSVGETERFPVGMRVLAVDDNPTCLMLLDGLLRKCQYQVTTTSQAKTALKMLREDRSRFDLVISDVEMPDMDGFKLLELVGLEMDLPVIMLSSYSDPKLVMKGIKHGACDYLVKPIRIEELRNIWQHLVRRKKLASKSSTLDKDHQEHGEGGNGPAPTENADQNRNLNRKRKDEEEEEEEENGEENEDSAIQKKPRVVWSIELHGKFVAAVNQLGIEKAVPKRVLDMMNVEGITRENVASHLQKYRLYLKRISSMETQRTNMVATLGGTNSSSMHMNSFDGLRDFRTLSGNGRLSNPALSSYQTGGILGRLNSPAGVSLHCLSSSALIQPRHAQNLSNSIANLGKPQSVLSPANQNAGFFQGIPTPLELDQLDQSKCAAQIPVLNTAGDPITFADDIVPRSSSSNPLTSASRYCLFPQGNLQQTQRGAIFGIQSSSRLTSLNSESFNAGISGSSLLDDHRCNENWQNAFQPSKFSPNPLSESFNPGWLPPNSMASDNYSPGLPIHSSPLDFCSTDTISAPVEDSNGEIQCRTGFIGDYTENSNHVFSTLNSMVPSNGIMGSLSQVLDPNNGVCNRKIDASLVSQSNSSVSTLLQFSEVEKSAMDSQMWSSRDYHLEQTKSQEGFVHNGCDSLDDLMNGLTKRGQDGTVIMDGEFGFDAYSFGSC